MFQTKFYKDTAGQSLIEVLIATTALVFVLVGIVAGLVLSVHNTTYSNQQSLATKYAQESIEVFRRFQNELGWPLFQRTIAADGSSFTYCMANEPTTFAAFQSISRGACSASAVIPNTNFTRQIVVTVNSANQITLVATVSWDDGQETRQATITQILRNWQKQ